MSQSRKRRSTLGLHHPVPAAAHHGPQQENNSNGASVPANDGPRDRTAMIADAAYFRAKKRAFCPGRELDDWLAAEREIDSALARADQPPLCD